ncbi:MAG: glycosyltransferase [Candidatus Competibacteraceae bacterium]|nr:glycosyltransferase [Candidatus Competibacteraceae bacterium]
MLKPENVVVGQITETSQDHPGLADIALNPMLAGSGTNLKMLDYFAAGIPVISTATGARGLDVRDEDHLLIRPIEAMAATIESCLSQPEHMARITQTARKHVEEHFDWRAIAEKVMLSIKNAPRPSSSQATRQTLRRARSHLQSLKRP